MLRFWKMKSVRVTAIIALAVAVYAVVGFVLAPRLVRSALLKDIPETIATTPAVGEIRINPFLFQVTVDKFSLSGKGGEKLLGFERLFIDFDLSSLWHRAYSFGNIELTSPFVSASIARDGSLNLLQLKPKAPPKPDEKSGPLPALRIGSFRVIQGSLSYDDHSQTDVFSLRLEPINFALREFTTGVEGGQFKLTAASKLGEKIEWHGHVSVDPVESDGEFRVDGLKVHTLWEYLEDKVNFVVNSGSIELGATYKFAANAGGGAPQIQVDIQKVGLTDLAVRPKDSDVDWIVVPSLGVTGTTVDVGKRHAHVESVALSGLKVLTWLEPDGSVNLQKLAGSPPSPPPPAPSTPPAVPAPSGSAPATPADPPWQFELARLDLREASLSVEDRTVHPAVKVLLEPFALQVTGVSQDMSKPLAVMLDTHINGSGTVALRGDVTPQPIAADLDVKVAGIELAAIQPYLARRTSMTLKDGRVGAEAKVHYGVRKDAPSMSFTGNINVEKLHTVDNDLHDDFINWDRLDIRGMTFTQSPDRLEIAEIDVRKPYARVIIESDESLNVKRVLTAPGAAPPPAATPANPPAAVKNDNARPSAAPVAPPAAPGMPISVKKVVIEAGSANFADLTVKPNFATGIQDLKGSITGISSKADSRAKVDLRGAVDTYSPVTINGEFNALGPKLYTDIGLGFHNIELTVFNPYSGKFAGYNISKGKLTTDLHYKVDGRKLDAQHHIVVEQLEFGEKTASKDAVSLPIKLAVSLLKDRNGVIDLSVPVSGSLDDPQFRLGPLIWKVFVNILEKAVTAPFALLGSLFGGGPDIQFIDFQPGIAVLDSAALDKAKAVARGLIERPQLKIEVPIAVVPEIDRPALAASRLDAAIAAAQGAKAGAKKAPAALPYDQLEPAAQLELLAQLYGKNVGGEPKYPESVTGIKSKPDSIAAKVQFLHDAVRDHVQIGDDELQDLGQARAQAVQRALLEDSQVNAERVFLVSNDKAVAKEGVVRAELTLQ